MVRFWKKQSVIEEERVPVEIWADGKRVETTLPVAEIPSGSRPWNVDGKPIHSLERFEVEIFDETSNTTKLETQYRPVEIEVFDDKSNITPDRLHDALVWAVVQRLWRSKPTLLEKINTGLTIALLAILCLFTFLIFSNLVTAE